MQSLRYVECIHPDVRFHALRAYPWPFAVFRFGRLGLNCIGFSGSDVTSNCCVLYWSILGCGVVEDGGIISEILMLFFPVAIL